MIILALLLAMPAVSAYNYTTTFDVGSKGYTTTYVNDTGITYTHQSYAQWASAEAFYNNSVNYSYYLEYIDNETTRFTDAYYVDLVAPVEPEIFDVPVIVHGNISAMGFVNGSAIIAHDYLYASKGYYEPNVTKTRYVLSQFETYPDGSINKDSYPDYLTREVMGEKTIKMGVVVDLIITLLKDILLEIQEMKQEMCADKKNTYSWCSR